MTSPCTTTACPIPSHAVAPRAGASCHSRRRMRGETHVDFQRNGEVPGSDCALSDANTTRSTHTARVSVPDRSEAIASAAAQRAAAEPRSSVMTPDVDPTASARPSDPGAQTPNIEKTEDAIADPRHRSTAITILALLALLYTLYFARDFLVPIVYAVLLNFLLSPVIRVFSRLRVP